MKGGPSYSGNDAATAIRNVGDAPIPVLGFGTYGMSGPALQNVLVAALRQGFRHVDTAQIYQNEADVGLAIRASGVSRNAIFITTKVWVSNYARQRFMTSVDESLRKLRSDHIDLLLVHWPRGGASIEEQIEGLNRVADSGKVRHIGVSNYNDAMMRKAAAMSRHPLVTNQVEYHPFLDQTPVLREVASSNSSLMAYCGMAIGRVFHTPILADMAMRHGRTVAQIVLRWLIQQPSVLALSRTEKIERISQNTNIFDFALTDDDMARIGTLKSPGSRIVKPSQLAPDWD
jgi:2,5-diketo-D-gluconate reductase B